MLQFLRARRGRKAAVAAISPWIETSRRRFDGISDQVWLEPYMLGFIGTLITVVARREVAFLTTDGMGLVQMEAWAELTGLDAEIVGEEICLLSEGQDQEFLDGCRSAYRFVEAQGVSADSPEAWTELAATWASVFDVHVAGRPRCGMSSPQR